MSPFPSILAGVLLALCACDRRVEPWIPADQEPPAPERPVRIPGLGEPRPSAETLNPARRDFSEQDAGEAISGRIQLQEGAELPPGGVLFVIVRSGAGGPPLAVKRLAPGPFPMDFAVGAGDVMIQGRPFAGPMQLSARLDADGDPLTRGAQDLSATHSAPIQPGSSGIKLLLASPAPKAAIPEPGP